MQRSSAGSSQAAVMPGRQPNGPGPLAKIAPCFLPPLFPCCPDVPHTLSLNPNPSQHSVAPAAPGVARPPPYTCQYQPGLSSAAPARSLKADPESSGSSLFLALTHIYTNTVQGATPLQVSIRVGGLPGQGGDQVPQGLGRTERGETQKIMGLQLAASGLDSKATQF